MDVFSHFCRSESLISSRTTGLQGENTGKTGAARKFDNELTEEAYVEAIIAALQADVSHIKTDVDDVKADLRELRGDLKAANSELRGDLSAANAEHRSDMKAVNEAIAGLRVETANIRKEIAEQRCELKTDHANQRTELKEEIAKLRTELKGDMAALRTELKKDLSAFKAEVATEFGKVWEALEKIRGSQKLIIATNTIGQLLTAGVILGVVGRALKWF